MSVPVRLAKVRVGRDTVTGGTAATLTRTLECAVSGKLHAVVSNTDLVRGEVVVRVRVT